MAIVLIRLGGESSMAYIHDDYEARDVTNKVMVKIHCKDCGEVFRLRGVVKSGRVDTGLKMCFCGNENLEVTPVK